MKETHNAPTPAPDEVKKTHHLIKYKWLRIPLKIIMWVVVAILLIPVLVYLPPVQRLAKNIACSQVEKSTGMHINIGSFSLRWPLKVNLHNVDVVEADGDTMVSARRAIVDVRIMPLLKLDVKINRLQLIDGYYRMVSPDSSMIMAVRAGTLTTGSRTAANLANGHIFLDNAELAHGSVSLYMNVWKQEQKPPTPGTFVIEANKLHISDFRFAMSMLPTIDTLTVSAAGIDVTDGLVDLVNNKIHIRSAQLHDGDALYLVPDAAYIASHPAPAPSPYPSVPIVIKGDSLSLSGFTARYATSGVQPQPGFDPSYISMKDLSLQIFDFYNEASTVTLPIAAMSGVERSGLTITSGRGRVGVDSIALTLSGLNVKTIFSKISANGYLPFTTMAMQKGDNLKLDADASLGVPDIEAFMPALKTYTGKMSRRTPLDLKVTASGTVDNILIPDLELAVRGLLAIKASGEVANVLDSRRLSGKLKFSGKVTNPSLLQNMAGLTEPKLPPFSLDGTATALADNYTADFSLRSPEGNIAANGRVGVTSEKYQADIDIHNLNVGKFVTDIGIGLCSGTISASGAGFNPTLPGAATQIHANISRLNYGHADLGGINLDASLHNGAYTIDLHSTAPQLCGDITGGGTVAPDNYTADLTARLSNFDPTALGLMTDTVRGSGVFTLNAKASPDKWLYDVALVASSLELQLPQYYFNFPHGIDARFFAGMDTTMLVADADRLQLDFRAASGLKELMSSFTNVANLLTAQIERKHIDVTEWQPGLPKFNLELNASGSGFMHQFLDMAALSLDSINVSVANDSIIAGNACAVGFATESLALDTITFNFGERNGLIDYAAHIGNRPGNLDEFHQINASGYVGGPRLSMFLRQQNLQGQTGYRLGFTAAFTDSLLTLHFTPLKATIAYMPWTFNDDNYIDYDFDRRIDADLRASSADSRISIRTQQPDSTGYAPVLVNLDNIKIQDFLGLVPDAPPVAGAVNADMKVGYRGNAFIANGNLGISDLVYDHTKVGNLDLNIKAGLDMKGRTAGRAILMVNDHQALTVRGILRNDSSPIRPGDIKVTLDHFPLNVANAFIPGGAVRLSGALSGHMGLTRSLADPLLNGALAFDSAQVYIPMMGGNLKLDSDSLSVADNVIRITDFNIWGANSNPLTINGVVNAANLSSPNLNLSLGASEFMLINNDKRARSDIYGKILLSMQATARGPLNLLDVNGNLNVLSGTDAFYTLSDAQQLAEQEQSNVVKFVNFADTVVAAEPDSVVPAALMRINAAINISNGVQVTVNLSTNGTDKVQLTPSGQLTFFQNYMGDMHLNGQLNLGTGFARYAIPVLGEKRFDLDPDSYVLWAGDIMNPRLHILASDNVKSVVQVSSGNSRVVDFNVGVSITNTLEAPALIFDLSTEDLTIENELQSMSADQRSSEAMNMLLYGRYMGPGAATSSGSLLGNPLYSFLESQLNSWAANNIRGVDLTFGIDQYNTMDNGRSGTSTSYSYQVSKSLFDNKFKIVVGGNYDTDASGDENLAQNLISDISFQYMLRQTNTMSMYLSLFRHNDYENILEGEITETGVAYVMQRKLSNLRQLFSWLRPKKKRKKAVAVLPDTVPTSEASAPQAPEPLTDSLP